MLLLRPGLSVIVSETAAHDQRLEFISSGAVDKLGKLESVPTTSLSDPSTDTTLVTTKRHAITKSFDLCEILPSCRNVSNLHPEKQIDA